MKRIVNIRDLGLDLEEQPDEFGDRSFVVFYCGRPIGILVRDSAIYRQGGNAWFLPIIRGPQANCDGRESGWVVNDAVYDRRSPLYVRARQFIPALAEDEALMFPTAAQAAVGMLKLLALCGAVLVDSLHWECLSEAHGVAWEYVSEWE